MLLSKVGEKVLGPLFWSLGTQLLVLALIAGGIDRRRAHAIIEALVEGGINAIDGIVKDVQATRMS